MIWREIWRRLMQAWRLCSCVLNVFFGSGHAAVTWSAGSWQLRLEGRWWGWVCVALINTINLPFVGRWGHCREAWVKNLDYLRAAGADVPKGGT